MVDRLFIAMCSVKELCERVLMRTTRPSVLFVMPQLNAGGAERSLINLFNELPTDCADMSLLLLNKTGSLLSQIPEYVNLIDTPSEIREMYGEKKSLQMRLWWMYANAVSKIHTKDDEARRQYRWKKFYSSKIGMLRQEFDTAVAYISGESLYYLVEKVHARRKVAWIHNDYESAGYHKGFDEPYLERVDDIVTISDKCANALRRQFPGLKNKIKVLPNISSLSAINKQSLEFYPQEYSSQGCNLLSIGRLNPQKGFDFAVDAAKILKDKGLDFHWYIVGPGNSKEINGLNRMIKRNGLERNVSLLGIRDNPYPYIRNCDIFVQPSRFEGKSVVLDEAKLLCRPILVTNYQTANEQITDQKNGVICDMTPQSIAESIMKMLYSPELLKQIRHNLQESRDRWSTNIEDYVHILTNVG